MDRRDFLLKCCGTGLMVSAVAGCSKEESPITPGETIDIDLRTNLLNPGSFLRTRGVLVIRMAAPNVADSFSALTAVCPHAGGDLGWEESENRIVCPVHGSRFTSQGVLVNGPAAQNLKVFRTSVSGQTLSITLA